MTRLQKLRPYLIFFAGSLLFMTFFCFLLQDFVSDFFEDLFDTDDIGYGVIAFIISLIIYLLWSVIGGILYYKLTHRIILPNLASFAGYCTIGIIFALLQSNPTRGFAVFVFAIGRFLVLSILPLLVSVITMLLSKLSERNKSEQEKEQEEKEVL